MKRSVMDWDALFRMFAHCISKAEWRLYIKIVKDFILPVTQRIRIRYVGFVVALPNPTEL